MTTPATPAAPAAPAALARLQQRQRARLDALISQTEAALHADWQAIATHVYERILTPAHTTEADAAYGTSDQVHA